MNFIVKCICFSFATYKRTLKYNFFLIFTFCDFFGDESVMKPDRNWTKTDRKYFFLINKTEPKSLRPNQNQTKPIKSSLTPSLLLCRDVIWNVNTPTLNQSSIDVFSAFRAAFAAIGRGRGELKFFYEPGWAFRQAMHMGWEKEAKTVAKYLKLKLYNFKLKPSFRRSPKFFLIVNKSYLTQTNLNFRP